MAFALSLLAFRWQLAPIPVLVGHKSVSSELASLSFSMWAQGNTWQACVFAQCSFEKTKSDIFLPDSS